MTEWPAMKTRRLFIAGATGAVGRTLMRLAPQMGVDVVPHVRPKTAGERPPYPDAVVLELSDTEALAGALRGCTTVVQLIGTMRKRFASGDTYETSDIGTTEQLVEAAKKVGSVDHFVLLSSVGAGQPMGAYLKAKARAEEIVRDSGLSWTVFRPSAFIGEGHKVPWVAQAFTRALGARRYQPIRVEQLASAILKVSRQGAPLDTVLEGDSLWQQV
jgi:uncharacterized protein YbjT (DUF2867 family)